MSDKGNTGLRRSICVGDHHANDPSLRCSGARGRPSLGRATVADSSRAPHQIDSSHQEDSEGFSLSPQEQRIVALVAAGYANQDMARRLSLSGSTIYRRIVRILSKLGVCNKVELVLFAISRQLFVEAQP